MSLLTTLNASRSAIEFFGDRLSLIGTNIASTQTPGYDRQRQMPTDSFYQQLSHVSNVGSSATGGGVRNAGRETIFTMGELAHTDQSTDLAINGRGWFPVQDATSGELRLTRVGNFDLDDDGFLHLPNGQRLLGIQGPKPAFEVSLDAQDKLVFSVAESVVSAVPGTTGSELRFDWKGAGWDDNGLSFAETVSRGGKTFPLLPNGSMLTSRDLNAALGGLNGGQGLDFNLRYPSFTALENAVAQGALSESQADAAILHSAGGEGLAIGSTIVSSAAEIRAALDGGEIIMPEVDEALLGVAPGGLAPAWNSFADIARGLEGGFLSEQQVNTALSGAPLTIGGQTFDGAIGGTWSDLVGMLPLNPETGVPYTMAEIAEAAPQALGVSVQEDGLVEWKFSDGTSAPAAWLRLAEVRNPGALAAVGDSLFAPTDEAFLVGDWQTNEPGSAGRGGLVSGALEMSNVDLTEEFADLLASQRSYQASSRMLSVMDELLTSLTQLRR